MLIEVVGTELNLWEQVTVNVDNSLSMLDLQKELYSQNIELDEQTTLELYLDHDWLNNHILEVINDFNIMSTPLAELFKGYAIYKMVEPTMSERNQF